MKSVWFDAVFLKSIFDRTGVDAEKWLTAKQTAICTQHMERKTARIETAYGYQNHENYVYNWNGREVWLSYSKKNGCSTIHFGYTAEEQAQASDAYETEKKNQMKERAERKLRLHPEKYAEHIERLKSKIADYQAEINESIEENDIDGIDNLAVYVNEMQEELEIWKSVSASGRA